MGPGNVGGARRPRPGWAHVVVRDGQVLVDGRVVGEDAVLDLALPGGRTTPVRLVCLWGRVRCAMRLGGVWELDPSGGGGHRAPEVEWDLPPVAELRWRRGRA